MLLVKDGQAITLDNENHIEAFKASGWAEANTPAAAPLAKEEAQDVPDEPMNEPIIEERPSQRQLKKTAGRKKQEK